MALTTVDDVAAMLRWGDAEKTKYVGQLGVYVGAASELVEAEVGPVETRSVQHVADGADSVALPYWATAITTVEMSDGAGGWTTLTGWTGDLAAGIVYGPFATGRQNIRVTFTSGYASDAVPDSAKLAATMIAADKWAIASQRAPGLDDQVDPSYLMPKVVRELLAPLKKMPGFA